MSAVDGATRLAERYGSWALVTGGSSGIGRAFARALAADGMSGLLVSDEPEELETTCGELTASYGVDAEPLAVDLGPRRHRARCRLGG